MSGRPSAKGPASAATDPDRGSNPSRKEKAVNEGTRTIPPGGPTRAPFDYGRFFQQLEQPIYWAANRTRVLSDLAECALWQDDGQIVSQLNWSQVNSLMFMIDDIGRALSELERLYDGAWPRQIQSEIERGRQAKAAREVEEVELADLISAHRQAERAFSASLQADEAAGGISAEHSERTQACIQAEVAARSALLAWRPTSKAGVVDRLHYLMRDPDGPWRNTVPCMNEVRTLFGSMMEAA